MWDLGSSPVTLKLTLYPHMIYEQEIRTESAQWAKWPGKGYPRLCLSGVGEVLGEI